jgi:hypothetical protein
MNPPVDVHIGAIRNPSYTIHIPSSFNRNESHPFRCIPGNRFTALGSAPAAPSRKGLAAAATIDGNHRRRHHRGDIAETRATIRHPGPANKRDFNSRLPSKSIIVAASPSSCPHLARENPLLHHPLLPLRLKFSSLFPLLAKFATHKHLLDQRSSLPTHHRGDLVLVANILFGYKSVLR